MVEIIAINEDRKVMRADLSEASDLKRIGDNKMATDEQTVKVEEC